MGTKGASLFHIRDGEVIRLVLYGTVSTRSPISASLRPVRRQLRSGWMRASADGRFEPRASAHEAQLQTAAVDEKRSATEYEALYCCRAALPIATL
jgi:hypothetical protein